MGKGQQRKGADGERELAEILEGYSYPCRRGGSLTFGNVPDIDGLPGIHVEVKRVEHLNICRAMEQARNDASRFGGLPAVFHRKNRGQWLVTMDLSDWMELYQEAGDWSRCT